jgi:signal transduction histidine kinase
MNKLKNKILFFFILLIVSFTVLIIFLIKYDYSKTDTLLQTRQSEKDTILTKILNIKREEMIDLVYNFTSPNEIPSYISMNGNDRITSNFAENISIFNLDIFWIFDKNYTCIKTISNLSNDKIIDFPLEESLIKHILATNNHPHFFIRSQTGLMEIAGYSIRKREDLNNSGSTGHVFAARLWTQEYINNLEDITESKISVTQTLPGSSSNADKTEITNILPLKGWNNATVSYVIFKSQFSFITEFTKTNRIQHYFAVLVVFLILLSIFTFFYFFISKPVNIINEALYLNDTSKLTTLLKSRSEFGDISRLIMKSNKQRIKILEEIEARKKSEIELKYFFQKAEEANKLKSFLLANMSHEFRTPLSAIIGFTDILKNEINDTDQQKMLNYIESASERLLNTLVSILELAQLETTKLRTVLKPLDLSKELKSFLENYKFKVEEKSLDFEIRIPEEKIIIFGDLSIMTLILRNLLDNAVKFTSKGSIKLIIEKTTIETTRHAVIIIEDTGIGIPKDKLAVIFDEFRQVSEGYNRHYEGIGLGLTVAKKLTEILNGTLSVQSYYGKGSVFKVLIPLMDDDVIKS